MLSIRGIRCKSYWREDEIVITHGPRFLRVTRALSNSIAACCARPGNYRAWEAAAVRLAAEQQQRAVDKLGSRKRQDTARHRAAHGNAGR